MEYIDNISIILLKHRLNKADLSLFMMYVICLWHFSATDFQRQQMKSHGILVIFNHLNGILISPPEDDERNQSK